MPWVCDINPETDRYVGLRHVEVFATQAEAGARGMGAWHDWAGEMLEEARHLEDEDDVAERNAHAQLLVEVATDWSQLLDAGTFSTPHGTRVDGDYEVAVYHVDRLVEIPGLADVQADVDDTYVDHRSGLAPATSVVGLTERLVGRRQLVAR